jgi:hypothetical protein
LNRKANQWYKQEIKLCVWKINDHYNPIYIHIDAKKAGII